MYVECKNRRVSIVRQEAKKNNAEKEKEVTVTSYVTSEKPIPVPASIR